MKELWKSLLAKVPTWDTLIKMSRNKIVNSSYVFLFITPIAAKITQHLPEVVQVPFGSGYQFSTSLPFSWLWLFWCALAASTANVIVLLRCPTIVSKYQEWGDFERSARGLDQLRLYAESPPCSDFPFDRMKMRATNDSAAKYCSELEGIYRSDKDAILRQVDARNFNELRDFHEKCRNGWRLVTSALYVVAISCFVWIVVKNTLFVMQFMVGSTD